MNDEVLTFFQDNVKKLHAYAYGILKDDHAAEDIMQEVWIKLSRQNFSEIQEYKRAWIFSVCRNACCKIYNKRQRYFPLDEDYDSRHSEDLSPSDNLSMSEDHIRVLESIKCLTTRQKEILKYRYYDNLSYKEISNITKLKMGNISFILNDIKSRLKKEYDRLDKVSILKK
jgi:RNA polymerase sigma-70 factor (ECF subfamily)